MKVLYYNWVDYLDSEKRGGGVSVYQRNLLGALDDHGGVEAHFLSSGIAYDVLRRGLRWVELAPVSSSDKARRFEIVNSGLTSPSHADYGSPAQVEHAETEAAFMDFVARNGPYDVIHFNNLEGLPAAVLRVKERWPDTRVVLSLHNYYPFCPQVNLWYNESANCTDFAAGERCVKCLPVQANPRGVRIAHATAWHTRKLGMGPGTFVGDRLVFPALFLAWRGYRKLKMMRRRDPAPQPLSAATPETNAGAAFAARRAAMVDLINGHADAVLCVSDRVRKIAAHHGIAPGKLHTSYIGTQEAAKWESTQPKAALVQPDGTLRLAYLGYMRRDKGFFFLLDALEALPPSIIGRLRLTIAARCTEAAIMTRLKALAPRLAELRQVDGYTHAGLDALLADVDLGVVPVMWEDNLPQVAIEMHARHIPLLTSDRGGAQELGRCPEMVFRAGDSADFARVLGNVLSERVTQQTYWQNAMAPVSMPGHLAQLLEIYQTAP